MLALLGIKLCVWKEIFFRVLLSLLCVCTLVRKARHVAPAYMFQQPPTVEKVGAYKTRPSLILRRLAVVLHETKNKKQELWMSPS